MFQNFSIVYAFRSVASSGLWHTIRRKRFLNYGILYCNIYLIYLYKNMARQKTWPVSQPVTGKLVALLVRGRFYFIFLLLEKSEKLSICWQFQVDALWSPYKRKKIGICSGMVISTKWFSIYIAPEWDTSSNYLGKYIGTTLNYTSKQTRRQRTGL